MMHTSTPHRRLVERLFALTLVAFVTCAAGADTVGYWRFESGAFLADSSGNDFTLSEVGTPDPYTLPASGRGSDFPNPIPQTGAANGQAAYQTTSEMLYYDPDGDSSFNFGSAMTVECLFDADYLEGGKTTFLMSNYTSGEAANSSWIVGISKSAYLKIYHVDGGGSLQDYDFTSAGTIVIDHDYYFAMTFDDGTTTVYLQDLTAGTAMSSQSLDIVASLQDGANSPFTVGGIYGGSAGIGGIVDEVRLSNTVLSTDEFLISVPEPATMSLVVLGGAMLLRRRRRR